MSLLLKAGNARCSSISWLEFPGSSAFQSKLISHDRQVLKVWGVFEPAGGSEVGSPAAGCRLHGGCRGSRRSKGPSRQPTCGSSALPGPDSDPQEDAGAGGRAPAHHCLCGGSPRARFISQLPPSPSVLAMLACLMAHSVSQHVLNFPLTISDKPCMSFSSAMPNS